MIINYECRRQRAHQPRKRNSISGSISKRGMNFVVIGKCGSFYIYHEKAGKKNRNQMPRREQFLVYRHEMSFIGIFQQLSIL